jgi:mannosylglucosylglycerate synthase
MNKPRSAFLHYSAAPVVGGVEAVIDAHALAFREAGYPVTILSGRGEAECLPEGTEFISIPELDSQHAQILEISAELEQGRVPEKFEPMRKHLVETLRPILKSIDVLFVHNIFTKHYNLPLTAALVNLQQEGSIRRCLAWCHDFSWTSSSSKKSLSPGFPWDLLRTAHPGIDYVTISEHRQKELMGLLDLPAEKIDVVYNGVDPCVWFGLTPEGWSLIRRLDMFSSDLIILMPLRVTRAKNIELAEKVLAVLKERGYEPRLVVTGPPDPHNEDSLEYYQSLLDLRVKLDLMKEMKFVFDAGPDPSEHYEISQQVAADLVRVSDMVFMPSHREGFGMPVLEAGLLGVPVVVSDRVPAALEIGGTNVFLFNTHAPADEIAGLIIDEVINQRSSRFRSQIRKNFTWEGIFHNKIERYLREDPK